MEVISICLVRLVQCAFNAVHWITRDGSNCDLDDILWDTGTIGINMSYVSTKLEGEYSIDRGRGFLIIRLGHES